MSADPFLLELRFVDGHADGIVAATVLGWSGHVLSFPRTQLAAAMELPEAKRPVGAYLLLGDKDETPCIYVGESEDLQGRLGQHLANKPWWTRAVLLTSSNHDLTKAHVRHIEARLHKEATLAGMMLDNSQQPGGGYPPAGHSAFVVKFVNQFLTILPFLRVDSFLKPLQPKAVDAKPGAAAFALSLAGGQVEAEAVRVDGLLVMRAGAKGRGWSPHPNARSFKPLWQKLVSAGILVNEGDATRLVTDHGFDSPSAAATILNGQAINGQTAWKLKGTAQTYKDWEQAQIAKEAAE